jgi:putative protease
MNPIELLAPAGNLEKLKIAIHYGADAVYLGLSDLSLRAKADNFDCLGLKDAIDFCHQSNVKAYITINIFPHNRDLPLIKDHLELLNKIQPDAIILSDMGVFDLASTIAPKIPIHISTQANITNCSSAKFWERLGAKRLILSRELSIDEIREIRQAVSIELECFVHGSICISYSGRCYMSSFMANRSANHGQCANSCRWNYSLMEEKRPGEYLPVYENERGTFVLSSRDLCMINHLDKIADAGVNSFKIEGRIKGINYVAGVVKVYRDAINSIKDGNYVVKENWLNDLLMSSNRGFTTGMFLGRQPDIDYNHDEKNSYRMTHTLVGIIKSITRDHIEIALRNTLRIGDTLTIVCAGADNILIEVDWIRDVEGNSIEIGKNEGTVFIKTYNGISVGDIIRRASTND